MNVQFIKDNFPIQIQVNSNDLFCEVAGKYMQKAGITDPNAVSFFFNNTKLRYDSYKDMNELGFYNNAVINVLSPNAINPGNFGNIGNVGNYGNTGNIGNIGNAGNVGSDYLNICFTILGRNVMVQGQSSMTFSDLVVKFLNKAVLKQEDKPKFILNGLQVPPNSTKTLKQLNLHNMSKIDVFMEKDIIGA